MTDKTNIIVSTLVDATVTAQQPDIQFKMFRQLEQLGEYLESDAIRADVMFITSDTIVRPNSSFSYIIDLLLHNNFLKVNKIVYITEEKAPEVKALRYLLDEHGISNWEVIEGHLTRAYVSEVINGTYRQDMFSTRRKAVIRKPRREYVRQHLRDKSSLSEDYVDDETDLMDIPDEPVPVDSLQPSKSSLRKVYITGEQAEERTAFVLLAAQYLSLSGKTIVLESDAEYHSITEFVTKSELSALLIPITTLFDRPGEIVEEIRRTDSKLIVLTCVDRFKFSYRFLCDFVYYNLCDDADYLIIETHLSEVPPRTNCTVVIPNTVIGCLEVGEQVAPDMLPYCRFVAVSYNQIPEVHINSGVVLSKILQDVLSDASIVCPVVTVTSLRINSSPYDLGSVIDWR